MIQKSEPSASFVYVASLGCSEYLLKLFCLSIGSEKKEVGEDNSDLVVSAPDLMRIVESSILTFHLFVKMDKKKTGSSRNIFGGQNQMATPVQQIQSTLEKVNFST